MNQYYELSTPTGFAFDKLKILNSEDDVASEISSLLQLREVENASQLLLAAGKNLDKANPYDYCFKNLNCAVKPVDSNSEDYELLMRYINSSFTKDGGNNRKANRAIRSYRKRPFNKFAAKKRAYRRPAVQHKNTEHRGWVVQNVFEVGSSQHSQNIDS